jgi:hypothetical protein
MNDIVTQAEAILQDIANETDPLKCCIHHRKATDLLPELIKEIKSRAVLVYEDGEPDLNGIEYFDTGD